MDSRYFRPCFSLLKDTCIFALEVLSESSLVLVVCIESALVLAVHCKYYANS